MIKETGTVVKVVEDFIWVETTVTSSCNACAAKSNCGTSAIAKAFSDKSVINEVENVLSADIGDTVEIGIPEESVLVGSFYLYLLPILTAILMALVAQFWLSSFIEVNEPMVILATFLGGFVGFLLARRFIERADNEKYKIQLLAIKPQTIEVKSV
ncbi:MAG: SoxR reducing system RseC family protein [Gammaproteobacteria bacterium]|nr:SoxR reducing system RseC family protein [Gammaproteobacteria bacterium]